MVIGLMIMDRGLVVFGCDTGENRGLAGSPRFSETMVVQSFASQRALNELYNLGI